jgi:ATPase subunit of ABC transporter with duplicated ATPase domains
VLFDGIGFAVGPGRSALIGANGSGKSTLLRLIAGELVPSRGSVQVAGSLGWLRQDLTLAADLAVEEVLGITRARRALRAIEAGEAAAEHFAAVGDDWDVEERAHATLAALLLADPAPQLLLLDEPTNNLDLPSLGRLSQALAAYRGALLVASHDLPFLRAVGITRWLRLDGRLTQIDPP